MKLIKTFDQLLDEQYGKKRNTNSDRYKFDAHVFMSGVLLKEARVEANLTQKELANKAGTKKSYISKLENGKGNIQLSTLIRIFEQGLNRRIGVTFLCAESVTVWGKKR